MIGMLVIDEMMTGSGVMDGTMVIHQVAMQQWTSSNGPILGIKMMVSGSGVDLLPGRIARIGDKMESGRSEHGVGVTGTLVVDGLTMASGMSAENSTHGATVRLERQMPVNLDQAGAVEESAPSTSNSEGKSGKTREPKTGKEVIPSWDGTTPIRDYKKRIDLFLSTTAIDPEYRAGRLVEQLSGVAWRAVDTMDVTLLRHPEGVQHLLAHLRSELEPVEFLQTFGVLTNFYKKFKRQKGESFIEFDNRYRVQLQKLKEVDAELNDLSKAYWFLETASISEELRKQCISASGGVLQYEKLRTALISIVPSVRRDEDGDFARSTKDVNDKKPFTPRGKAHGVNVVAKSDDDFQEIENEPNDDEDDATPPDLEELERQAEVLVTQASKRRAEVEKRRGFSRQGPRESSVEREQRIKKMKASMACLACRAHGKTVFGHWHNDDACPYKVKSVNMTEDEQDDGAGVFCAFTDDENDSIDSYIPEVHAVLLTTGPKQYDKTDIAVSDTGCSRTVAGSAWMRRALRRLWKQQIPFYCTRESQAFRFGPGPKVLSEEAVWIPTCLQVEGATLFLRVSVVPENVPLLVSHKALTQMGAVLDLPNNQIEMKVLQKTVPMIQNAAGHVGFCIWDESMSTFSVGRRWEALLETDDEVCYLQHEVLRTRVWENTESPRKNHRPIGDHHSVFHTQGKHVHWRDPVCEVFIEPAASSSSEPRDVISPSVQSLEDPHGDLHDAEAQGRVCGSHRGCHWTAQGEADGAQHGAAEGGMGCDEASEGPSASTKLAQVRPPSPERALRRSGRSILSSRRRQSLAAHEAQPVDHGVGAFPDRPEPRPQGAGGGSSRKWYAGLSKLWGGNDRAQQPHHQGAVPRVSPVSDMQVHSAHVGSGSGCRAHPSAIDSKSKTKKRGGDPNSDGSWVRMDQEKLNDKTINANITEEELEIIRARRAQTE